MRSVQDPDTGRALEYRSLVAELATVVMGGLDPTGHQLSCILALLAASPHVVQKIIYELKCVAIFRVVASNAAFIVRIQLQVWYAIALRGLGQSQDLPRGRRRRWDSRHWNQE